MLKEVLLLCLCLAVLATQGEGKPHTDLLRARREAKPSFMDAASGAMAGGMGVAGNAAADGAMVAASAGQEAVKSGFGGAQGAADLAAKTFGRRRRSDEDVPPPPDSLTDRFAGKYKREAAAGDAMSAGIQEDTTVAAESFGRSRRSDEDVPPPPESLNSRLLGKYRRAAGEAPPDSPPPPPQA